MVSNDIAEYAIHFIKDAHSMSVVNGKLVRERILSASSLSEKRVVLKLFFDTFLMVEIMIL